MFLQLSVDVSGGDSVVGASLDYQPRLQSSQQSKRPPRQRGEGAGHRCHDARLHELGVRGGRLRVDQEVVRGRPRLGARSRERPAKEGRTGSNTSSAQELISGMYRQESCRGSGRWGLGAREAESLYAAPGDGAHAQWRRRPLRGAEAAA